MSTFHRFQLLSSGSLQKKNFPRKVFAVQSERVIESIKFDGIQYGFNTGSPNLEVRLFTGTTVTYGQGQITS